MPQGPEVSEQKVEFTATPTARRLQEVGQKLLGSDLLQQVAEHTFTTCEESIEDFGDRLIAANIAQPLIEVSMLPRTVRYYSEDHLKQLKQVFDIDEGQLVLGILRSTGHTTYRGYGPAHKSLRIETPSVNLALPFPRSYNPDLEISSYLLSETFSRKYAKSDSGGEWEPVDDSSGGMFRHEGNWQDYRDINVELDQIVEDLEALQVNH